MAASFPLQVILSAVDRMSGPLQTAGGNLTKLGRKASNVGRGMTTGLTAPIVGVGAAALTMAGGFQAGMNRVRALLGASKEDMADLEAQAKELGATTAFSAREAAAGMGFLAQAGFDSEQIMAAMPGTLALAAAGQLELASAADISSNVLTGYGLAVADTNRVVDVLAAASSSANTNVEQLGEAFKIAGPVAAGMGLELEETAAIMGALGNAGFQASLAGTAVRGALSKLANPATEAVEAMVGLGIRKEQLVDSEGNVRSLVDVVDLLATSGASTADLLTIFGERAGPAMAALVNQGAEPIRELRAAMDAAGGSAQRMADVQMEGAAGATLRLKSAAEGLLIAVADSGLLEAFTGVAERLAGWFSEMRDTNPALLRLITIVGGVVAAVGPMLILVGQAAVGIGGLMSAAGWLAGALSTVAGVVSGVLVPAWTLLSLAFAASPIGFVITLVAGLVAALVGLANTNTKVGAWIRGVWQGIVDWFKQAVDWIGDLVSRALDLVPDWAKGLLKLTPVGLAADAVGLLDGDDRRPLDPAGVTAAESTTTSRSESTVRLELGQLPPGARVETFGDLEGLDLEVGQAMAGGL